MDSDSTSPKIPPRPKNYIPSTINRGPIDAPYDGVVAVLHPRKSSSPNTKSESKCLFF